MNQYIVSARKYRPDNFKSVVGQDTIVRTLKNAILNDHLAQAFLFTGPRGVGKTTCARIMAKTINCLNIGSDGDACNECDSCNAFNSNASFNIHELDAASNNSVEDIRNLVEQVRIPPQEGKYKIYIIDEVHMLSQAAFNAFLKTLEEPPAYAKFILATTERHKIIPTILSRCQIYNFRRISVEDIATHLAYVAESENVTAENDALHIIAQKADGALRDALSLFDQIVTFAGKDITYQGVIDNLNILDFDYYFRFVDFFLNKDYKNAILVLNEVLDNGFDAQHIIIGLAEHLRQLLVAKDPDTLPLLEAGEMLSQRYQNQAASASIDFIIASLNLINETDVNYRQSSQKKLLLESLFLQLCFGKASIETKNSAPAEDAKKKITTEKETPPISSESSPKYSKTNTPKKKDSVQVSQNQSIRRVSLKESEEEISRSLSKGKKSESFNEKELKNAVLEYAESIKSEHQSLHSVLTSSIISTENNEKVKMVCGGDIQKAEVEHYKQSIVDYLREKLQNDNVLMDVLVDEKAKSAKNGNLAEDRFNELKEKNPDLDYFRNTLNLKVEL
ncbi:MAG: DNA polymerase III subunit gamma/tau [Marinilabiliales bacterium]|nr:MAG: DNA polymerase III subunit gamma/tau [Marinilabiliales bacterium]